VPVYNLEVDTDHVYRVTELGLLVHNASFRRQLLDNDIPAPESVVELQAKRHAQGFNTQMHGHHVAMKEANSSWPARSQRHVKYAQKVLESIQHQGEDLLNSLGGETSSGEVLYGNVIHALNKGHSQAYARKVAFRLKQVRKLGRDAVLREIREIGLEIQKNGMGGVRYP
jgi:hypothetical protein